MQELEENEFRRSNPTYLAEVDNWFKVLLPKIAPFMHHNGGPVIMVQIENEYGWYNACDKNYLRHRADLVKGILGEETFLFTNDGGFQSNFECGALPEVAFVTVDFRCDSGIAEKFELQRRFNGGTGPYASAEFYPGWMDHWQEAHSTLDDATVVRNLDLILSMGASVVLYMYYGGTNPGFYNGANGDHSSYQADPTSYDYNAPLTEAGDMTSKYYAILDVIKRYRKDIPNYDVCNSTKKSYGIVTFTEGVSLYDALNVITDKYKESEKPLTFEELDHDFGYILYRGSATEGGTLKIPKVHDRAYVFVDRKRHGIIEHAKEAALTIANGEIDILVEHMGRNNYGNEFVEKKGLVSGVTVNDLEVTGWKHYGFNMSKVRDLVFSSELPVGVPAFYRGTFNVDEAADTFLNPTGFVKGVAFVNGVNIGRYWTVGPQLTLYVPAPLLKPGENELIVFEQESLEPGNTMTFDDVHVVYENKVFN